MPETANFLTDLSVAALRDGVADGSFSATEVATAFNANVAAAQGALNAFIVTTPDKALEAAAKVDADRAAGKALGKLAGVPIGMKDLFATKGVQTTAASHILEGFTPNANRFSRRFCMMNERHQYARHHPRAGRSPPPMPPPLHGDSFTRCPAQSPAPPPVIAKIAFAP
jgi:hypothetical protein